MLFSDKIWHKKDGYALDVLILVVMDAVLWLIAWLREGIKAKS